MRIVIGKLFFISVVTLFSLSNYLITFRVIIYWVIDTYKANIPGIISITLY